MRLRIVNRCRWRSSTRERRWAVWEERTKRWPCWTTWCSDSGRTTGEGHPLAVATALAGKGGMLSNMNRHTDALAAWNEVTRRFGKSRVPALEALVVNALIGRAVALNTLNRHGEALEACDEVLDRVGKSGSPVLHGELAAAMVGRGHALIALNRVDEAINAWGAVVERFGTERLSQNRRTGGLGACERGYGAVPVGPVGGGADGVR